MDPSLIASGASLFGNIASGIFQHNENVANRSFSARLHAENIAMQKEFAKNGIRWRVEDAKNAGIHPLAALGASGAMYTPSSTVGASNSDFSWLSEAGQNIGTAVGAVMTRKEKAAEKLFNDRSRALSLANQAADLEYTKAKTQSLLQEQALSLADSIISRQPGSAKSIPSLGGTGQVDFDRINLSKNDVPFPSSSELSVEAGHSPEFRLVKSPDGYAVIPGSVMEEAMENQVLGGLRHELRLLQAVLSGKLKPSNDLLQNYRENEWRYNPIDGVFREVGKNENIFSRKKSNKVRQKIRR